MQVGKITIITIVCALAGLGYLVYQIISPFLTAIAWAVVFSIVFYPVYLFLSRLLRFRSLASAVTLVLIILVIIGPFTSLSLILLDEARGLTARLHDGGLAEARTVLDDPRVVSVLDRIRSYVGHENLPSEEELVDNLKKMGAVVMKYLSVRIPNIVAAAVDFIFMLFASFFLLRDGPAFLQKMKDAMPFEEIQKDRIAGQVKDMIVSTVYGGVVVAIVQGALGGIAFAVAGIDSPILWGFVMSVMSFVPLLGTFSIWGPASVILLLQGDLAAGFGLLIFGVLVISMVDNILKPLIIGSRTKMHTIVIFFSVLGGLKLFGLIGLIMGPLLMAVFFSVFEIFVHLERPAEETNVPSS